MNSPMVSTVQVKWLDKLPPLRYAPCALILSASLGTIVYLLRGPSGLWAAAVAAGVCWLGSLLALTGTAMFGRSGPNAPLFTLFFGMVFNCALPFAAGLALYRAGGALAEAGVFGLTIICFQFALFVETVLALCLVKTPMPGGPSSKV
jgi:hypothetical protein